MKPKYWLEFLLVETIHYITLPLEIFLNVFTEFSDKKFVITVKALKPATQPPLV